MKKEEEEEAKLEKEKVTTLIAKIMERKQKRQKNMARERNSKKLKLKV